MSIAALYFCVDFFCFFRAGRKVSRCPWLPCSFNFLILSDSINRLYKWQRGQQLCTLPLYNNRSGLRKIPVTFHGGVVHMPAAPCYFLVIIGDRYMGFHPGWLHRESVTIGIEYTSKSLCLVRILNDSTYLVQWWNLWPLAFSWAEVWEGVYCNDKNQAAFRCRLTPAHHHLFMTWVRFPLGNRDETHLDLAPLSVVHPVWF